MPDAFSCHAFDYILKPITRSRVFQVLLDAQKLLPGNSRYIEVNSNRQNIPVFLSDIQSAATDAHYLDIHLKDGNLVRTRMTASEFLKLTGEDCRFLVINKGLILNMDYIFNMENNSCIMTDGSRFPRGSVRPKSLPSPSVSTSSASFARSRKTKAGIHRAHPTSHQVRSVFLL